MLRLLLLSIIVREVTLPFAPRRFTAAQLAPLRRATRSPLHRIVPVKATARLRHLVPQLFPPASKRGVTDLRSAVALDQPAESFGHQDFFIFIKDYGWSLRYRVMKQAGSFIDQEHPLQLEWIKLHRPLASPDELTTEDTDSIFDWSTKAAAKHAGFMYEVTQAIDTGVEAVVNFFKDHGLKFLVRPDTGVSLLPLKESDKENGPQEVTHCWVQVMGMPFLPMLQSIAFYNFQQVVLDYQA
jgi:hypothetical protein